MDLLGQKPREKNQQTLHRLWFLSATNVMAVSRQYPHIRNTFHVAVGSGVFCNKCFGFDIDLDAEHELVRCILPSRSEPKNIEHYGFEDDGAGRINCTACWLGTSSKNSGYFGNFKRHPSSAHNGILRLM